MSEWVEDTLGHLASIEIGGTPSRDVPAFWADEGTSGHPWVSIADLGPRYVSTTKEKITALGVRSSNVKHVESGTLIMSFKLTIGRAGIAACNLFTNEAIAAIIPEKRRVDSDFLYYLLPPIAKDSVTDTAIKGRTLNKQKLARLRLRFPKDVRQQHRIAEILSTLDETIEQTEALIAKMQQVKAGMMHDLFTRGVTPDGRLRPTREQAPELYKESPLGWIPREWGVVCIEDMCGEIVDCPHSTPTYVPSGIPCIRTADMLPGKLLLEQAYCITEKDYRVRVARLVPQKGDVIYSREGERLGIASPVGDEKVCLGQRVMMLRPAKQTDPAYLVSAMNAASFYRQIVSGLGATTSPHVNVGDIRKARIAKPPTSEQSLIGRALSANNGKIAVDELGLLKLRQKKHGLMHDLLSGRVLVVE